MDDGFQFFPTVMQGAVVHHCYFLDSPLGGLENDSSAPTFASQAIYFAFNIFDHRCPHLIDTGTSPQSEPYLAAFNVPHYNQGVRCPYKFFNNTVIWSPDANGNKGPWLTHTEGGDNATSPYHENFNNIVMVMDYQRYVGNGPSGGGAWLGQCSSVCRRMITTVASEAHDYCILWRNVPNPETNFFQEILHIAIGGNPISVGSPQDFNTLAAWQASGKFNESKGKYAPGFHANSFQIDPQMPSGVTAPADLNARMSYRPAASQASSGYASTTNAPSGESMAGWLVKPAPWIGALDPAGTDCPVGVQLP
jgi:hypothetical protein